MEIRFDGGQPPDTSAAPAFLEVVVHADDLGGVHVSGKFFPYTIRQMGRQLIRGGEDTGSQGEVPQIHVKNGLAFAQGMRGMGTAGAGEKVRAVNPHHGMSRFADTLLERLRPFAVNRKFGLGDHKKVVNPYG